MNKPGSKQNKKVIIFFVIFAFLLINFVKIIFLDPKSANAQAPGIQPVTDPVHTGVTVANEAKRSSETISERVENDLKALFYKNILGSFFNKLAQDTALLVATGHNGEDSFFVNDWTEYYQGVLSGFAVDTLNILINSAIYPLSLNVCTLDPSMAINLALQIPMFPTSVTTYTPSCTWEQLSYHYYEELRYDKMFTFSGSISEGGTFNQNTSQAATTLKQDKSLKVWDGSLLQFIESCTLDPEARNGNTTGSDMCAMGNVTCTETPPIQTKLIELSDLLIRKTEYLQADVNTMMTYALSTACANFSNGECLPVVPSSVDRIRNYWIADLTKYIDQLNAIGSAYGGCLGKTASDYAIRPDTCKAVASDLRVNIYSQLDKFKAAIPPTKPGESAEMIKNKECTSRAFESNMSTKVSQVQSMAGVVKSGFEYLKKEVEDKIRPEYFEGATAYNYQIAKDVFKPQANPWSAYDTMTQAMMKSGFNALFNQVTQASVNQGWKAVTDTVSGIVKSPASLIHAKAVSDLTRDDGSKEYMKSIGADAMGVFLSTLWNEYMRQLLASLNQPLEMSQEEQQLRIKKETAEDANNLPIYDTYNPYQEELITPQGVESYIKKLGQQFEVNFSYRDLDLLADFQKNLKGELNPNLYNNVIDGNFAVAINNNMTIKEAIDKGKLVGSSTFSWQEQITPGTYHLANLKKLRKARVIPLGLELAAQLVRDCNYRATLDEINNNNTSILSPDNQPDFAEFQDLSNKNRFGYDNPAEPLKSQRLKNCMFKPLPDGADFTTLNAVVAYNKLKLQQVLTATLADVVNGYGQAGDGTCGDFDDKESPFCNLVNPNWVLKLPITRCASQTTAEPYSELLMTNKTGQRYSSCSDFASCIFENTAGSCFGEEYGFCVKEANSWQFSANSCPSQFNSCRTYYVTEEGKKQSVSYLKNTLSGNDICGPNNAGCVWYSTKADEGGNWFENNRIYLNRYAETCDRTNEGCSQFYVYRDSANNVIFDSSFEYTSEGSFPVNWDLRLKKEVASQAECPAGNSFYGVCLNYDWSLVADKSDLERKDLCVANGGEWVGSCSVGSITVEAQCLATSGASWTYSCQNAIKDVASVAECDHGVYTNYCVGSVLKYNGCFEPRFDAEHQTDCYTYGGTWRQECEINGQVDTKYDATTCEAASGNWLSYCQGAIIYDSTKEACASVAGIWKGYGPFSEYAFVSKDGTSVSNGLGKLQLDITTLDVGEELQLIYRSKFAQPGNILTKGGDVYTASAGIKATQGLSAPILFNLIGGTNEVSSTPVNIYNDVYNRPNSTIITGLVGGDELDVQLVLPGGQCSANGGSVYDRCVRDGQIITILNSVSISDVDKCTAINGQWKTVCSNNTPINVFVDAVRLSLNNINEIRSGSFATAFQSEDLNTNLYYKKPPVELQCRGYEAGDPPAILSANSSDSCLAQNGYWDQPTPTKAAFYDPTRLVGICYQYPPDNPICKNYMKVCKAEEAGCQLYTPTNGDPAIPGVVSSVDLCLPECVGYNTYKQESALYEPQPDPLYNYFIPETAQSCSLNEVGCAEFTNLGSKFDKGQIAASANERVEYYTYIRQCVAPNDDVPQKTYFTWQGSASGPPQIIKYEFEEDPATGGPRTIDASVDCRISLGENDLSCIKYYDGEGNIYFRDVRKTVVVSDQCLTFRKTESTETNCLGTNGVWQAETGSCLYDGVPSESLACSAAANGCRAFIGNRGNNVFVRLFDTFENNQALDWYVGQTGINTGNLQVSSESVSVGGHSLQAPNTGSIHKFIDIQKGSLYTLSFWAKTDQSGDKIKINFSTAVADSDATTLEEFASLSKCSNVIYGDKTSCEQNGGKWNDNIAVLSLTTDWKNYTVGPVYISWDDVANNALIFDDINSNIYLDNILLKVVKDNVYVIKNSWKTPAVCDTNFFGAYEKGAMIGCSVYNDTFGQTHYLKSFTNLCRESVVGCQILVDTKNSVNPNQETFNGNNAELLDDYTVPKDELTAYVLDEKYSCDKSDKGCQKLGKPVYGEQGSLTYTNVYIKNDPDKYFNIPKAIMCNDDALGCVELSNQSGGFEYYKIEPTKLCSYSTSTVNNYPVEGWFKRGSTTVGCGALNYKNCSNQLCTDVAKEDCSANGFGWSEKYQQCTLILNDVNNEDICNLHKGEWRQISSVWNCLANPFDIYKSDEANKYKGYVGLCGSEYNNCTEFIDVNPNFISNGSFEVYDQAGRPTFWAFNNPSKGSFRVETDDVKIGDKALRLIKRTPQNTSQSAADNKTSTFGLNQTISDLQQGKTYKISFYYKVPASAVGLGETCSLPSAAFHLKLSDMTNSTSRFDADYEFSPETEWKRVDVFYTVPVAGCSDIGITDETNCLIQNKNWYPDDLYKLDLTMFAPSPENCVDSYILYDLVEFKDNTEDSYYVIDSGTSIDRATCKGIDWNNGCVQFINGVENISEIIKVKRDRQCEQWSVCASQCSDALSTSETECIAKGATWDKYNCTATKLCAEETEGKCTKFVSAKDNVRYSINNQPLVVRRITDYDKKEGYIYRYGSGAKTDLTEWRAGDYSGYTVADRLPIEAELDLVDSNQGFTFYSHINNLSVLDQRYVYPMCKIFPADDSPLPSQLLSVSSYKNIQSTYSPDETLDKIGNGCFYEKATASGVSTYFSRGSVSVSSQKTKICTTPEEARGKSCTDNSQCVSAINPNAVGNCVDIGNLKEFIGQEGMCLEFDTSNPLYDSIYKNFYGANFTYQPYACLSYYPFLVDVCALHKAESGCIANPACQFVNNVCEAK